MYISVKHKFGDSLNGFPTFNVSGGAPIFGFYARLPLGSRVLEFDFPRDWIVVVVFFLTIKK